MTAPTVTVAIPVLDGSAELRRLLPVIRGQRFDGSLQIVVADSESRDGSAEMARAHGAEVVPVQRGEFSHGGTRNLLMERSRGELVAFLTQDALPAHERWLAELTEAFSLSADVGLAFGPGLPRPGASLQVRRDLTTYFRSLAPAGAPVLVRSDPGEALGASSKTYFHSVNACVSRAAWSQTPFRTVPYAEDRMLSLDMLRAGWAKAFVPAAAVVHSHQYQPVDVFRRSFDEARGLREVAGHYEPYGLRLSAARIVGQVRADIRFAAEEESASLWQQVRSVPGSFRHACLQHAGAVTGSRAGSLTTGMRRRCSLERRDTFVPQRATRV